MQLYVIFLLLGILVRDSAGESSSDWPQFALRAPTLAAIWLLPKLALALAYWIACRRTLAKLGRPRGKLALRRLDKGTLAFRYAAILLYVGDLLLGVLDHLRLHVIRNLPLIDELVFMTPMLLLAVWAWWAYYPIDRRLREASLISQLDSGRAVPPIWTRGQYLLSQVRHQMLLVLVPMLIMAGWHEAVALWWGDKPRTLAPTMLTLLGSGCVFLVAPVMIRRIWDTVPLPAGELRDRLSALCATHRVGVRELLLWRTYGGMINAAVMGLLAPVRYILLTDGLLDLMPTRQIEAVMAHEVAHVRRRHLFWLLLVLIGSVAIFAPLWELAVEWALGPALPGGDLIPGAGMALSCAAMFGWVSRRFERQADTFAVQHMAMQRGGSADAPIETADADAMVSALQQVADLNQIPTRRRSWRHGSIAWRQAHLRSLVGQRVGEQPIDRQVRWIKLATALIIVTHIALLVLLPAACPEPL